MGDISSPWSTLTGAVFSPDGRWVAYASRKGRASSAIFVEPFPPTGAKYQISKDQDDGHHPVWTPDGTELLFTPGGSGTPLSVVRVSTKPAFSVSEETALPRPFRNTAPLSVRTYDIAPDGQHIIGLVDEAAAAGESAPNEFRIVLNWHEELKRLVPSK